MSEESSPGIQSGQSVKVSILTPVYGVEAYMEKCARSLFEQTYDDIEYIFIDDCTPDRSIDILTSVMADYPARQDQVKIIRHEKNRGLSASRNTALDAATGDFVFIVDSDDWITPDAVKTLVCEQGRGDYDIVTGQAIKLGQTLWHFVERPQFTDKIEFVKDMATPTLHHSIWGRLIRRGLFEENSIRAKEGANCGEDMQQMVQLAYHARNCSTVCQTVYYYNCTNEQSYMNIGKQDSAKKMSNARQDLWSCIVVFDFLKDKEPTLRRQAETLLVKAAERLFYILLINGCREIFCETKETLRPYNLRLKDRILRLTGLNYTLGRAAFRLLKIK